MQRVHVFNSCSASVGETLIAKKIAECEEAGLVLKQLLRRWMTSPSYAYVFCAGEPG